MNSTQINGNTLMYIQAAITIVMILVAVYTLFKGFKTIDSGRHGSKEENTIQWGAFSATTSSIGAFVMVTACIWGIAAAKTVPSLKLSIDPNGGQSFILTQAELQEMVEAAMEESALASFNASMTTYLHEFKLAVLDDLANEPNFGSSGNRKFTPYRGNFTNYTLPTGIQYMSHDDDRDPWDLSSYAMIGWIYDGPGADSQTWDNLGIWNVIYTDTNRGPLIANLGPKNEFEEILEPQ